MAVKNILVTGVSGFLGKSIVAHFSAQKELIFFGHSRYPDKTAGELKHYGVTIIDDYFSGQLDSLNIDCIIHLAGIAHDLSDRYTPEDYFRVNEENTIRLYDAFLKSKATKFIFLSSIKAAVDTASTPVTETVACNPVTPYGQSKRNAEVYIQEQVLPSGKSYYILRPCMIHGPGNKGNLNLLYKYVKTGLPYPLASFHNQRSFLSVRNFNFILGQLVHEAIPSGIYHLADDGFLSTTELFKVIAEAIGKPARVVGIPQGIIRLLVGAAGKTHMVNKLTEDMMVSNEKLLQQLKQSLPFKLRDGLTETIQSFREP